MALEGLQLGQYRLLRFLGSGGMGEVYLAEDARINQQVAIKVSRTEALTYPDNRTTQDTVRLFQREAKAIARLDHPYILSLFSYGEENVNGTTFIYIVMPYRHEGSFANWLQERSDNELLSVQDVAHFLSQAAGALQYAHDNQIVHQDVKPSNFLIRTNKEHPQLPDLLLADFGIARLNTSTSSISHSIRGTPAYMAPEQWSGEPIYATDQYALAVLAYELLAGRPPFAGRQEQVMYQHFNVQPQSPGVFNPQLSRDIDAVILKALAKQPGDRFPSISAFARAFQQSTSGFDESTIIKAPYTLIRSDLKKAFPEQSSNLERTMLVPNANSPDKTIPIPNVAEVYQSQPINRQQGVSTGTAILLVGLAFLLIIGGLGFVYLYNITHLSANTTIPNEGTPNFAATSTFQAAIASSTAQSNNAHETATANALNITTPVVTAATGTYVQLKSSYSGTASGYTNGDITFTLKSEDSNGNISMQTTFQQLEGAQKIASYSCQGSVTTDRYMNLQCFNVTDSSYELAISGYIFPDGHMEGTETATNTNDPAYNHVYSWKAY